MKRLFSGLLVLALTLCLWGCSMGMPEQTVICGELTVTLPANFLDLSDQHYDKELMMVFGYKDVIVSASRESATELESQIPGIDGEKYAQLVVQSNGIDTQVENKDGIPTFTYTMGEGENAFTYVAGVFASENYFWLVQCFCPAEVFSQHHSAMWHYLTTVTIR